MPDNIILESKNPNYEAQVEKYELWQDLYEGGDAVEKKSQSALVSIDTTNTKRVNTYLPQHAYESDAQYEIRKDRATYRNFAKPVTGVFLSAVWRKQPERKLPPALEPFENNVDLQGTKANDFFKEQDRQGSVKGVRFILVDSTKAPEDSEIKTEADRKKLGLRPYFVYVDALELIDWGFERNESTGAIELSYITIEQKVDTPTGPFEPHQTATRYKVWTRSTWEVWEDVEKTVEGKKTSQPEKIEEGTHGLGIVPLVPTYFRKKKEFVGDSCFAEVDSLMLRIYRRDSELDKSLFDAAVPLFVTIGINSEDLEAFVRASSNGLSIPEPEGDAKYVEPTGVAFEATRQAIQDDERAIREIVLRIMRPDTKVGESAEAKKIDRQQLDSQLANFSQNCEDAERKCWELALKWLNTSGDIEIEYNKDFDTEQLSAEVIKIFQDLRTAGDISRETLWEILKQSERMPAGFDADEESARIEEDKTRDARSGSTLQGLAGRFLTQNQ